MDTVRIELADPPAVSMTEGGLCDKVRPLGDELADKLTVPAKLLMLVRLIVDIPDEP